jgi:outer membrane immunogenic protein
MKSLVPASMALAVMTAGPALAADLPVKAPVYKAMPAPVSDWTGFYIGLNGGYSWGSSATDYTTGVPAFSTSQPMDGWVFGGQAGYNWQINQSWLIGLEADLQATGQDGTATLPTSAGATTCVVNTTVAPPCTTTASAGSFEQKLPWLGTARLRLGVLPGDHWLLYATGGLAVGEIESNATVSTVTTITAGSASGPVIGTPTIAGVAASSNTTKAGWTLGGGVEWVLSGQWTAKLEYLYVDLGTVTNTLAGLGSFSSLATSSHVTDNIVRVGVNYRFGGPVVAKY